MVVDMRCPKCGGNTARYEGHRWRCLECSNFVIYEPPISPTTNNYVNVAGNLNYDLDISNATAARPLYGTLMDKYPDMGDDYMDTLEDIETYRSMVAKNSAWRRFYIFFALLFGVITLFLASESSLWAIATGLMALGVAGKCEEEVGLPGGTLEWSFVLALGVITVILASESSLLAIPIGLLAFGVAKVAADKKKEGWPEGSDERLLKRAEEKKTDFENQKRDQVIEYQPICPYCHEETPATERVLAHCLKCGKRFYYVEPTSYPIKER